ncbi:MAG: serine/threonine protein kinase [Planctomycetes bacterium]|nr:serine/threonine protein kinase [Planctomycetota bacterium]
MPATPRPSIYNLQRFLLGTLSPAEAASVAAWVESSPDAARALAGVAAHDALTKAVAGAVGVRPPLASRVSRVVGNVTGSYVPAAESVPDVNEQTRPSGPTAARFGVPNALPERIGPFRVVRELGRGGMGVVYEAVEEQLGRKAAVKVLAPDWAANAEARQRFLREARAAADLKSDHIVTIYQVGEADGLPFLAMEFIEGVTLETWRKTRSAPVAVEEVMWAARELLSGLSAAHKKGRVHRDIKPANAMIERATNRVKILDFGLTRGAGEGELLTSVGRVLGTPAFMSPEQANGKAVDPRSDLFSVGVTLYALVKGHSPFRRDTVVATLLAVATEHVPPLAELPAPLSAFVARLMSKNPDDRPADAGAALAELRALGAPIPDEDEIVRRPHRTRNRILLAIAAVLLAATVVLVAGERGDKLRSSKDEPRNTQELPPPKPPGPMAKGSRVQVPFQTGGYSDTWTDTRPSIIPRGRTGTIIEFPNDKTRCRVRLDTPKKDEVWIYREYLEVVAEDASVPAPAGDEPGTLKPGETYKDELTEHMKATHGSVYSTIAGCYGVDLPIRLKARQSVIISATVAGKGRRVLIGLSDRTDKLLGGTRLWGDRAIKYPHDEVPADGTYKITVISDLVGPFTLDVSLVP